MRSCHFVGEVWRSTEEYAGWRRRRNKTRNEEKRWDNVSKLCGLKAKRQNHFTQGGLNLCEIPVRIFRLCVWKYECSSHRQPIVLDLESWDIHEYFPRKSWSSCITFKGFWRFRVESFTFSRPFPFVYGSFHYTFFFLDFLSTEHPRSFVFMANDHFFPTKSIEDQFFVNRFQCFPAFVPMVWIRLKRISMSFSASNPIRYLDKKKKKTREYKKMHYLNKKNKCIDLKGTLWCKIFLHTIWTYEHSVIDSPIDNKLNTLPKIIPIILAAIFSTLFKLHFDPKPLHSIGSNAYVWSRGTECCQVAHSALTAQHL